MMKSTLPMDRSGDRALSSALQNMLMDIETDPEKFLKTDVEKTDCFYGPGCMISSDTTAKKENLQWHAVDDKEHLSDSDKTDFPPTEISTPQDELVLYDLRFSAPTCGVHVEFLNLRDVYEKTQSRINRQSRQRIISGRVEMVVTFDAQIQDIVVMVERIPQAKALAGDKCGRVSLKVKLNKLELNKQYFSVDLDSIYLAQDGLTPVYKLSTVDSERRNRFHLAIVLVFIDGSRSKTIHSKPFLLRSKKTLRCIRSVSY